MLNVTSALPATDRALVGAASATLRGAVHYLDQVVSQVRSERGWNIDVTDSRWTGHIREELAMASGHLEGMRAVQGIAGVDVDSYWGAISEVHEGLDKMDDLAGQTKRWRPLYDMVASDAKQALGHLRRLGANLDALAK